jgi:beta-lactamase class A
VDYDPGIAFTGASTIKIPIMISVFQRLGEPLPQTADNLMKLMIEESKNPAADELMQLYLDINLGPILVTDDLQAIGLENTFMGGYFYNGAPLLRRYVTPANQRFDYSTDPDVYNQTTISEMAMLLDDIYICAKTGGGTLKAVFNGDVSQSECQLMLTYLTQNHIANYISGGLPDGTQFAHKHGYTAFDGVTKSSMDGGIVFTNGGDYILIIARYQPTQLIYDVSNPIYTQLSRTVYNYFTIS